MTFFKPFNKSALISQFLLGIVAIFALPHVYGLVNENDQEFVIDQQVITLQDLTKAAKAELEKGYFLPFEQPTLETAQQAVRFAEFFANPYAFDGISTPPIRAGP